MPTKPELDSLSGAVEDIRREVAVVKVAVQPLLDGKWEPAKDIPAALKVLESVSKSLAALVVAGAAAWAMLSGVL